MTTARKTQGVKAPAAQSISDVAAAYGKHAPLPEKEQLKLLRKALRGDRRAADRLIQVNMRFLISRVIKRGGVALQYDPEKFNDFMSVAMEGFWHGCQKFKPRKGFKLLTYCVWWIDARIQQERIRTMSPATVPFGHMERSVLTTGNRTRFNPDDVIRLRASTSRVSLDEPAGGGNDETTRRDMIVDPGAGPEELLGAEEERLDAKRRLLRAFQSLSPAQRRVIHARFLAKSAPTLDVIAKEMDCSREWIRICEMTGIRRLTQVLGSDVPVWTVGNLLKKAMAEDRSFDRADRRRRVQEAERHIGTGTG